MLVLLSLLGEDLTRQAELCKKRQAVRLGVCACVRVHVRVCMCVPEESAVLLAALHCQCLAAASPHTASALHS